MGIVSELLCTMHKNANNLAHGRLTTLLRSLPCDYHFENVSLWTVDFTEVLLVVLRENLPCCYRAREGSIRATTTIRDGEEGKGDERQPN